MDSAKIQSFKQLRVWQDSMALAEQIYVRCRELPREELYGLCSQMKRAALSIPSNIAEGSQRQGTKELIQFLYIAKSSLAELETQLLLAQRLGMLALNDPLYAEIDKISRSIMKLIQSLRDQP